MSIYIEREGVKEIEIEIKRKRKRQEIKEDIEIERAHATGPPPVSRLASSAVRPAPH